VEIVVRARDVASRTVGAAGRAVGRAVGGIARAAGAALAPLGKLAVSLGAVATTAVSAAPLLAPMAAELFHIGRAVGQAAPALLAFAVAGKVVQGTLKLIFAEGSAARQALQPLADGIQAAGAAASRAAAHGLEPLVARFKTLNMPTIEAGMVRIGKATGAVMRGFLGWANSARGVEAVRNIMGPIGDATERLAPAVTRVAISFASMLGRIMGVSMAAGTSGLTGILDRLADKFDSINAGTVSAGFEKLRSTASAVWGALTTVVDIVKRAASAYRTYQTEFGAVADVLAVAAIAFGGPVAAIAGAVGLIIRHWDQLKAAYQTVVDYFTKAPQGVGFIENLRQAAQTVLPAVRQAFQQIWEKIGPVLRQIGGVIKDELIPAFGQFLAAAAPVARWFIGILGPWVATTMQNILNIVRGVLDILVGVFKMFTGILTGDWSKAWQGLVQILGGAGQVIAALFSQVWNNATAIFKTALGGIVAYVKTAVNFITAPFRWLYNTLVGGSLIPMLVNGIVFWFTNLGTRARQLVLSMVNAVVGFFTSMMSRGVGAIRAGVGAVSGAVGAVKNAVTGALANAASLLVEAGKNIIRGLIRGITSMAGAVGNAVKGVVGKARRMLPFSPAKEGPLSGVGSPEIAGRKLISMVAEGVRSRAPDLYRAMSAALGAAQGAAAGTGARGAPPAMGGAMVLELRSSGGRVDDLLLEILRGAISVRGGDAQIVLGR
jgi:phage-related protein